MPKDLRTRELAAIHVAAKQLGLEDDNYRAMLWSVARVRSAKDLDAAGRHQVLDHLRQVGARRTPRQRVTEHPGTPHNLGREPQLTKIEALLAELSAPWSYADGIARRMFGIDRVAWLRSSQQRSAVIAALDKELVKRRLLLLVDELLAELGRDRSYIEQLLPGKSRTWERSVPLLKLIIERLGLELDREQD